MGLRITCKPFCCGTPYLSIGNKVKVQHIASGQDLSDIVRNMTINIRHDEIVTATLECYVGEIDMEGVTIDELKEITLKNLKLKRLMRMIREE